MLREELYHPVFSHFPIAFLSVVPFVGLGRLLLKEKNRQTAEFLFRTFLYSGLVTYLVVLYLGDLSLEIIKSTLPKLQAAYHHEDMAYYTIYLFMGVLGFDSLYLNMKDKHWLNYLALIASFAGLYFLIQTGHSGATLVYEYGAAVKTN